MYNGGVGCTIVQISVSAPACDTLVSTRVSHAVVRLQHRDDTDLNRIFGVGVVMGSWLATKRVDELGTFTKTPTRARPSISLA
jgi:hypothetical protein